MTIKSYKDLIVWQNSMRLVLSTYELTSLFPRMETYGLASQMRRASISIPANIAEGQRRGTRKDYRHFLITAFGSGAELETYLEILKNATFRSKRSAPKSSANFNGSMKMLNVLISKLK